MCDVQAKSGRMLVRSCSSSTRSIMIHLGERFDLREGPLERGKSWVLAARGIAILAKSFNCESTPWVEMEGVIHVDIRVDGRGVFDLSSIWC